MNIKDLSIPQLQVHVQQLGYPLYRATQIAKWLYQKGATSFDQMSDLPLELREDLKKRFSISWPILLKKQVSKDGTVKYLFAQSDRETVESVLIPRQNRFTICVSSQVGCKLGCQFCASGVNGFRRHLTCGEIVDQVLSARENQPHHRITHVVFMGMGEPMDNYANVLQAVHLLKAPIGLNIGARKITLSTAGVIPGIQKLAQENIQVELSVSLHAGNSETRNRLMPINRKYSLESLISSCRDYIQRTHRQVTFEYTLISGINDRPQDADRLALLLRKMKCQVNLIPLNPIPEFPYQPPSVEVAKQFRRRLQSFDIDATIRKTMGRDIDGACGQLRLKTSETFQKGTTFKRNLSEQ